MLDRLYAIQDECRDADERLSRATKYPSTVSSVPLFPGCGCDQGLGQSIVTLPGLILNIIYLWAENIYEDTLGSKECAML